MALAFPLLLALYAARPEGLAGGDTEAATRESPGPAQPVPGRSLLLAALIGTGLLLPLVVLGYDSPGPLDLDNAPRQVHAALLRSFDLVPGAPWFRPNWTAASLLLTTPLYLWLAQARSAAPAVRWGWVAAGLIVALLLLNGSVGAPQFGYRNSLDVAPLLFLLLGWVFRDGLPRAARLAIVIGVAVSTYGMVAVGILQPPFAEF